jgi:Uma2 family endonuclease
MTTLISPHRFTTEDYHRLIETGILNEDDRVELLNGQINDMMPIGPFHGGCVKWLAEAFQSLSRKRWITSTHDPIDLGEHDEPQPDLALLRPKADFYRNAHPTAPDIFLVIEVSDSSLLIDRDEKLPIYARSGIPEVWIVNVPEKIVEVYRQPTPAEYTSISKVRPGERLSPDAFGDAVIDTAALFGRDL